MDYVNCYFDILGPLRATEEDRSDKLAIDLLILCHCIFQKVSSLTNGRTHNKQDVQLAILCGADIIACFNLLKRHITFNTFVLCKMIPFSMVHLFESAQIVQHVNTAVQRCSVA